MRDDVVDGVNAEVARLIASDHGCHWRKLSCLIEAKVMRLEPRRRGGSYYYSDCIHDPERLDRTVTVSMSWKFKLMDYD